MRIFFSTGEASGELCATMLMAELRKLRDDLRFEGNGGERMERAGAAILRRTTGWASLGPIAGIARVPSSAVHVVATMRALLRNPPAVVVLVDFGAFNMRLARLLRRFGFRRPIVYCFPPAAWLDRESAARVVMENTTPLPAFARQRDFYRSLGYDVAFYGHPLTALHPPRATPPAAPPGGGRLALLPGSRDEELRRHLPVLREAIDALRERRPQATFVAAAADSRARAAIERVLPGVAIAEQTRTALEGADAALIASGTAVLESALIGTPAAALYILPPWTAAIARRVYRGGFVTLPNLVLDRAAIPEILQEAATPQALADAADALLRDPSRQLADLADLRRTLGGEDALSEWAQVVLRLAETS